MKTITAKLKYLRVAPRKVRLVADLIRNKTLSQAQGFLRFSLKKASEPIKKLLDQAAANAKNNFQLNQDSLYISKITVDEGPKLKRSRARAKGRSAQIQKKSSHITLVLRQGKEEGKIKEQDSKIKTKTKIKQDKKIKKETDKKIKKFDKKEILRKQQKAVLKREFRRKAF